MRHLTLTFAAAASFALGFVGSRLGSAPTPEARRPPHASPARTAPESKTAPSPRPPEPAPDAHPERALWMDRVTRLLEDRATAGAAEVSRWIDALTDPSLPIEERETAALFLPMRLGSLSPNLGQEILRASYWKVDEPGLKLKLLAGISPLDDALIEDAAAHLLGSPPEQAASWIEVFVRHDRKTSSDTFDRICRPLLETAAADPDPARRRSAVAGLLTFSRAPADLLRPAVGRLLEDSDDEGRADLIGSIHSGGHLELFTSEIEATAARLTRFESAYRIVHWLAEDCNGPQRAASLRILNHWKDHAAPAVADLVRRMLESLPSEEESR